MTAQEVIKKFMAALDNQSYSTGTAALDDAVRNSSRFNGVQDALDNFFADQKAAERQAIKDILGNNYKEEYADLQLSDLLERAKTDSELYSVLSAESTYSYNNYNYNNLKFTAAERIRMETANKFLEECGIALPNYCFRNVMTVPNSDGTTEQKLMATSYPTSGLTGNTDTGAITGKDAGGENVKTAQSVVPEIGNKYIAKNSKPQIITTGTNDWIVKATEYSDSIYSGGADSINADSGFDVIYVEGNNATIQTGTLENDAIIIRENVKNVTLADLDQFDDLNIEGIFEVKTAKLDKTTDTATITDSNGRTLIIENWTNAKNSTVRLGVEATNYVHKSENVGGQKLGEWISNFIAYENTSSDEDIIAPSSEPSPVIVNLDDVTSIGGSFNLPNGARSATYNASSTSGNVGTVSSEFTGVEEFTTHGLTVKLWGRSSTSSDKNVTSLTYDKLTDDEKAVFAGLYKWWVKEGLKLNEESFGMSFTEDDVTKNTIKIFFYNGEENSGPLAFVTNDTSGNLELAINMTFFENISETDEDGAVAFGSNNTLRLDRTLAHELNHAIMKANISNFNKLPQFITEGLAELVHGIDDERMSRIWDLAARNTTIVGTDTTVSEGTVRLEKALNLNNISTGEEDAYAAGYMFLRYFAKKAAVQTENLPPLGEAVVNVSLSGGNATYYADLTENAEIIDAVTTADSSKVSVGVAKDHKYTAAAGIRQIITAADGSDWNFGSIGDDMSIVSGRGADKISIDGTENNVNLGDGNNSIYAKDEHNTITTGAGNDSVILDHKAKNNEINLGNGDNYVSITGSQTSITTGAGNDSIKFTKISNVAGTASSNYVNTGEGNDSLHISGYNNSIIAGAGDDSVIIFTNDSSIDGGAGKDYFQVSGADNIVNGGADDDKIYIYNTKNIINGDDGADYVYVQGASNIINGGAGNDNIYVTVSDNTIYGGEGYDTITVAKSSSLSDFTVADINPNEDTLYFMDIIGSIEKISDGIKVNYADSNISVNVHFADTDITELDNLTVNYFEPLNDGSGRGYVRTNKLSYYVSMQPYNGWKIEDGDACYYIEDELFAIIAGLNLDGITVVNGEIPGISFEGKNIIVSENLVSDTVSFESDGYILKFEANGNSFIMGTSYDDTVSIKDNTFEGNSGLTAYTFGGNDTVSVNNFTVKDQGFADIAIGADDDLISVSKVNQSGNTILKISGDAGNDSVSIGKVTQSGGLSRVYGQAGDDTISVSEVEQTDGILLVFGGNSDSSDFENNSSNDFISAENIKQNGGGYFGISGDEGEDTISVKNATVDAGIFVVESDSGKDSIAVENIKTLNAGVVSIFGNAGDDTISAQNLTLSGIYESIYSQIDGGAGKDIISVDGITIKDGAELAVIGGNDEDSISFKGTVTGGNALITGDGGANNISVESTNVSDGTLFVVGGKVNDTISVSNSKNINVISGNGNDTISVNNSTGVNIASGDGQDILSFDGKVTANIDDFSADDVISLSSAVSEATFASGVLTLGNVKLTFTGVEEITKESEYANAKIINGNKTVTLGKLLGFVSWEISGTTAKYGDLITVSGISSSATADDFEFDGDKTVAISKNALNKNGKITISAGYNLALGKDVTDIPKEVAEHWEIASGKASYLATGSSSGYVVSNNQISWQNEIVGKTLTEISGLSSSATEKDLTLNEKEVTVKANALDKSKTVSITGGYQLALDDDVTTPITQRSDWKVSNGTANYMKGVQSAGYVVENNQIKYQAASDGNAAITITGLKTSASKTDLELSADNVVTISANALDTSKTVTITGGTLALDSKVTQPTGEPSYWKVENGTANYYQSSQSAGYVIKNNKIVYQEKIEGATTITITGLSAKAVAKDISLTDENVVTLSKNALVKENTVSITGGTLELGKDVQKSEEISTWQITKNGTSAVANYMEGAKTEGYAVEGNKIVYKAAKDGTSKITVSGLKSSATAKQITLDESSKTVSLAAAAVSGEVSITKGYALEMGKGSYSKTTVVGSNGDDTISNTGSKLVIDGGAGKDFISLASGTSANTIIGGAGDDKFETTKGKNIYQYADGDGNDVIEGFGETDSLQITSGEISSWKVVDGDLIFTIGKGSITIKDGAGKKINTAIGTAKAVANIYTADGILNDKQTAITLRDDADSYEVPTKPAIKVVDGSAIKTGVEVMGSTAANSIIGGAGNDTLNGGTKGNDSIYGGAGADFIDGGEGADKLFGEDGNDTISGGNGNDTLTGGNGKDVFVYTGGNDVIADYAEEDKISIASGDFSSVSVSGKDLNLKIGKGSIKIKNSVGQKITVNDEVKIFEKGVTYNENKTEATLTAAASLESSVNTVDGSAMSAALKYSANDSANLIYGGKGGDSILGNGGNDTIFGNAGNDKLYGDAGNDILDGGAGNDSIFGGAGNNILTGGDGNDIFIYDGGNDLITDYTAGKDKIQLSTEITNAKVNGKDVILTTDDGNITVSGGADQKITTVTKIGTKTTTKNQIYTTLGTYNDKQTEITLNASAESYEVPTKPAIKIVDGSLTTKGVSILGNKNADKITGGNGKDNLNGGAGNDSLFGGAGADLIDGDAGNDKLFGEDGNDTISGGEGNDTLTGGDGKDVFVYIGGNDVIADYAEEDKISIASGDFSSVSVSGKDVTLKIGKGSIKIKNGIGQKVTVNDEVKIFEKGVTYNEKKDSASLTAAASLESSVTTVDGSAMSAALKYSANDSANLIYGGKGGDSILGNGGKDTIFGNAGNDSIWGGKDNDTIYGNAGNDKIFGDEGNDILNGDAGNDSLYGGEGNDTLTGGDGKDVFIFESGNDVIEDYSAKDDKIKFVDEITNTSVSGNDVIFTTANGKVTVKDGAEQKIAYLDFKNKSATYSAESTKTLDLIDDNNFMTEEIALDDISEQKFEVQNIETQNGNNLEQNQTILTYGEDK